MKKIIFALLCAFTISTAKAVVTISPASCPNGLTGHNYSVAFSAAGGTSPYQWTVVAGSVPAGTSLGLQNGMLTGVPTATTLTTYTFTIRSKDSHSVTANSSYTVSVQPLILTPQQLVNLWNRGTPDYAGLTDTWYTCKAFAAGGGGSQNLAQVMTNGNFTGANNTKEKVGNIIYSVDTFSSGDSCVLGFAGNVMVISNTNSSSVSSNINIASDRIYINSKTPSGNASINSFQGYQDVLAVSGAGAFHNNSFAVDTTFSFFLSSGGGGSLSPVGFSTSSPDMTKAIDVNGQSIFRRNIYIESATHDNCNPTSIIYKTDAKDSTYIKFDGGCGALNELTIQSQDSISKILSSINIKDINGIISTVNGVIAGSQLWQDSAGFTFQSQKVQMLGDSIIILNLKLRSIASTGTVTPTLTNAPNGTTSSEWIPYIRKDGTQGYLLSVYYWDNKEFENEYLNYPAEK